MLLKPKERSRNADQGIDRRSACALLGIGAMLFTGSQVILELLSTDDQLEIETAEKPLPTVDKNGKRLLKVLKPCQPFHTEAVRLNGRLYHIQWFVDDNDIAVRLQLDKKCVGTDTFYVDRILLPNKGPLKRIGHLISYGKNRKGDLVVMPHVEKNSIKDLSITSINPNERCITIHNGFGALTGTIQLSSHALATRLLLAHASEETDPQMRVIMSDVTIKTFFGSAKIKGLRCLTNLRRREPKIIVSPQRTKIANSGK